VKSDGVSGSGLRGSAVVPHAASLSFRLRDALAVYGPTEVGPFWVRVYSEMG